MSDRVHPDLLREWSVAVFIQLVPQFDCQTQPLDSLPLQKKAALTTEDQQMGRVDLLSLLEVEKVFPRIAIQVNYDRDSLRIHTIDGLLVTAFHGGGQYRSQSSKAVATIRQRQRVVLADGNIDIPLLVPVSSRNIRIGSKPFFASPEKPTVVQNLSVVRIVID